MGKKERLKETEPEREGESDSDRLSTVVGQLSGRRWWESGPPIILIAWPPERHRAALYAHHVLREPSFAVLQKWMTQRHSMKIDSARKVDALHVQTQHTQHTHIAVCALCAVYQTI